MSRNTCASSQPASEGFLTICHSSGGDMADEREKRVQNRLEHKVRRFTFSLNVEAKLEAMRNSAIGVER